MCVRLFNKKMHKPSSMSPLTQPQLNCYWGWGLRLCWEISNQKSYFLALITFSSALRADFPVPSQLKSSSPKVRRRRHLRRLHQRQLKSSQKSPHSCLQQGSLHQGPQNRQQGPQHLRLRREARSPKSTGIAQFSPAKLRLHLG